MMLVDMCESQSPLGIFLFPTIGAIKAWCQENGASRSPLWGIFCFSDLRLHGSCRRLLSVASQSPLGIFCFSDERWLKRLKLRSRKVAVPFGDFLFFPTSQNCRTLHMPSAEPSRSPLWGFFVFSDEEVGEAILSSQHKPRSPLWDFLFFRRAELWREKGLERTTTSRSPL